MQVSAVCMRRGQIDQLENRCNQSDQTSEASLLTVHVSSPCNAPDYAYRLVSNARVQTALAPTLTRMLDGQESR